MKDLKGVEVDLVGIVLLATCLTPQEEGLEAV
jgi:hypothetical protein